MRVIRRAAYMSSAPSIWMDVDTIEIVGSWMAL